LDIRSQADVKAFCRDHWRSKEEKAVPTAIKSNPSCKEPRRKRAGAVLAPKHTL
jgi:hypothetical protein